MAEDEHEHGHSGGAKASPLSNLSTKQKLLIGGAGVAVVLGIIAARNKTTSATPEYVTDDTLYIPPHDDSFNGGSGSNPGNGGTVDSGDTGGGESENLPDSPSTPFIPPIVLAPLPGNGASSPSISYDSSYSPLSTSALNDALAGGLGIHIGQATIENAPLGIGGIDYNTATLDQRQTMQDNFALLRSDTNAVLSEEARTDSVIAARTAAGMDITDQLKNRDALESIAASNLLGGITSGATVVAGTSGASPSAVTYKAIDGGTTNVVAAVTATTHESTAVSTTSVLGNAGLGLGGIDYNAPTTTAAQKAAIAEGAAKINNGDAQFIADEKARAAIAIADRTAAGLDISDQLKYQNTLNTKAPNVAPTPVPTPAPTPAPKPIVASTPAPAASPAGYTIPGLGFIPAYVPTSRY